MKHRKDYTNSSIASLLTNRSRGVLLYLAVFFVILILFILSFLRFQEFYALFFLRPVAVIGYYVLKNIGIPVTYSSAALPLGYCDYVLPHQVLRVNFGCTGIYVLFVFLTAVIAYPAPLVQKALGVLLGVPLFVVYSIVRLVVMGIVGNWFPEYLTMIHNYLMIVINIAFVLWMYVLWIKHAAHRNTT